MTTSKKPDRSVGLKKQADGFKGYTYRIDPAVLRSLKIHAVKNGVTLKWIFDSALSEWMEKHGVTAED